MNQHIVAKYWKKVSVNKHTGEEQWVRCTYTDKRITQAQADEMNAHYNMAPAEKDDDGLLHLS